MAKFILFRTTGVTQEKGMLQLEHLPKVREYRLVTPEGLTAYTIIVDDTGYGAHCFKKWTVDNGIQWITPSIASDKAQKEITKRFLADLLRITRITDVVTEWGKAYKEYAEIFGHGITGVEYPTSLRHTRIDSQSEIINLQRYSLGEV